MTSVVIDVLTLVYVFGNRVARWAYLAAVGFAIFTIAWVSPRVALEFVADRLGTDALTWFIRLSFIFLVVAPMLRRRRIAGVRGRVV
jgi:hypothetical protein